MPKFFIILKLNIILKFVSIILFIYLILFIYKLKNNNFINKLSEIDIYKIYKKQKLICKDVILPLYFFIKYYFPTITPTNTMYWMI